MFHHEWNGGVWGRGWRGVLHRSQEQGRGKKKGEKGREQRVGQEKKKIQLDLTRGGGGKVNTGKRGNNLQTGKETKDEIKGHLVIQC